MSLWLGEAGKARLAGLEASQAAALAAASQAPPEPERKKVGVVWPTQQTGVGVTSQRPLFRPCSDVLCDVWNAGIASRPAERPRKQQSGAAR